MKIKKTILEIIVKNVMNQETTTKKIILEMKKKITITEIVSLRRNDDYRSFFFDAG